MANACPSLIDSQLLKSCGLTSDTRISWLSPIQIDQFAEYRDQAFLDILDIHLERRPLGKFWPNRGPQWDALARASTGECFLVESKAHIDEVLSPGTKASLSSKMLIDKSFNELQRFLGIQSGVDWAEVFYQYANRLSHLYLLRQLNDIPAFLVFLYFTGDQEMNGPSTSDEWKSAIQVVKGVLGLRENHRLSKYVIDIFIDITQIEDAVKDRKK